MKTVDKPSEGLGDTIAKITHALKIDKVVEKTTKAIGVEDCGCERRRKRLNDFIPYHKTQSQ